MATIPAGSILVSNATIAIPCIFTSDSGTVLPAPSNPTFDLQITGLAALDDGRYCALSLSNITVYDSDLNVAATNASLGDIEPNFRLACDYTSAFYVIKRIDMMASPKVYAVMSVDPDTAVATQLGTFLFNYASAGPSGDPTLVGISPDGATAYLHAPFEVWSVSTSGSNVAPVLLLTEATGATPYWGFTLRNGELVVMYGDEFVDHAPFVKHYSAAGATLHTYTIWSAGDYDPDYIFPALDDLSFWAITSQNFGDFSDVAQQIQISDGTVLNEFDDGDTSVFFLASLSLTVPVAIGSNPPMLTFPDTPGEVGIPYSEGLVASGGTPPYTYAITVGTLPYGLSLDAATGVISGIPTNVQTANFTAQVTDDNSQTADCLCSIAIGANMTIKSVGLIDPVLRMRGGSVN